MDDRMNEWKRGVISLLVLITGLLTMGSTLLALAHPMHIRIAILDAHFTALAGISLIYLATLLHRGKQNAWFVAIGIYTFLIIRNIRHFVFDFHDADRYLFAVTLNLLVPVVTLGALLVFGRLFKVRSEVRSFSVAIRRSALVLAIAFLYGLIGFQLFDKHDFRQEIRPITAAHYSVDQLGLTTHNQPTAYTKRSRFFVDSLAAVSLASAFYVGVSFFAPIRFRLKHSQVDLEDALKLSRKYSLTSEDFFKFWPKDKDYFFSPKRNACLAYRVVGRTALVVGDPLGSKLTLPLLIKTFYEYCRLNDWQPAFVHTDATYLDIYKKMGFEVQKIGEEAIIDTGHFVLHVAPSKYFRQIKNRFDKLGYQCVILQPPHSKQVLDRLRQISDNWLKVPGRTERGFMMGYFNEDYLQQCKLVVAKDTDGNIQAFMNQLPITVASEANYDFSRQAAGAPGNIKDYLMLEFINHLHGSGIGKLNAGLSPLAGLGGSESEEQGSIGNVLNLIYSNSSRFYSFQGLTKFKTKYEPVWQPRYIVYRGGVRGFGTAMTSLLRAMKN